MSYDALRCDPQIRDEILIYVHLYVVWVIRLGGRVKVTLSLRGDLVRKVKSRLAMEGKNLSEVVEEFLQMYEQSELLDKICEELEMERKFLTSFEIRSQRPRGLRAEELIREMRDERSERLPGY